VRTCAGGLGLMHFAEFGPGATLSGLLKQQFGGGGGTPWGKNVSCSSDVDALIASFSTLAYTG
jgi:hypothetical protein